MIDFLFYFGMPIFAIFLSPVKQTMVMQKNSGAFAPLFFCIYNFPVIIYARII